MKVKKVKVAVTVRVISDLTAVTLVHCSVNRVVHRFYMKHRD